MHTIPLERPCPFCGAKVAVEIDGRRSLSAILKHPSAPANEFCYTLATFFASRREAESIVQHWEAGARKWEEGTR